jgi:hypothetical protein
MKTFNEKYYVAENINILDNIILSNRSGIKIFDKNKYYKIYHIHGSGTIYTIIEGDKLKENRENLFNIKKVDFRKYFFKIHEIRKQKLQNLNESNL